MVAIQLEMEKFTPSGKADGSSGIGGDSFLQNEPESSLSLFMA